MLPVILVNVMLEHLEIHAAMFSIFLATNPKLSNNGMNDSLFFLFISVLICSTLIRYPRIIHLFTSGL